MGTIDNVPTPNAYDAGAEAIGDTVESDLSTIVGVINGNLDGNNIADNSITAAKLTSDAVTNTEIASNAVREAHVDYSQDNSGVLVWRCGPNYAGAGGGRIARVKKTGVDFSAGDPLSVTFTFATDCVDDDPSFLTTAKMSLLGAPIVTASDNPTVADRILSSRVTTLDNTQAIIEIDHNASAATVTIEFGVAGDVS